MIWRDVDQQIAYVGGGGGFVNGREHLKKLSQSDWTPMGKSMKKPSAQLRKKFVGLTGCRWYGASQHSAPRTGWRLQSSLSNFKFASLSLFPTRMEVLCLLCIEKAHPRSGWGGLRHSSPEIRDAENPLEAI